MAGDKPADSLNAKIGRTLHQLRSRAGLTLSDLAERSGVSRAMISKIELGQSSPSLASLEALAQALETPFTNLFAATVDQAEIAFTPAGQGVQIQRIGPTFGHDYALIGRVEDPHLKFEAFLITISERIEGQPLYSQQGVEFIHVTEGGMRYRCGETEQDLREGDSLTFAAGLPHGPVALLGDSVTFLTIMSCLKDT